MPRTATTEDTLCNERRRLVWWIVYCFDSGFSITTGRPIMVSDSLRLSRPGFREILIGWLGAIRWSSSKQVTILTPDLRFQSLTAICLATSYGPSDHLFGNHRTNTPSIDRAFSVWWAYIFHKQNILGFEGYSLDQTAIFGLEAIATILLYRPCSCRMVSWSTCLIIRMMLW